MRQAIDGCLLRISISYGFVLAGLAGQPNIMTYLPVRLKPNFRFDAEQDLSTTAGLCHNLAEELKGWLDDQQPATTGGVWIFDLSVYTGILEQTGQAPLLLELTNLRLPLEDVLDLER